MRRAGESASDGAEATPPARPKPHKRVGNASAARDDRRAGAKSRRTPADPRRVSTSERATNPDTSGAATARQQSDPRPHARGTHGHQARPRARREPRQRPTTRRRLPLGQRFAHAGSVVAHGIAALPRNFVGWVAHHRRLVVALGVVALVMVALYGPAQRYYVALRRSGDLEAEAAYLDEDNQALLDDLSRLQTREGIEDEARRRGYTYENETSIEVNGVSDDASAAQDATDQGFSAADIEQPWYVRVLDFIFVYNGPDES